MHRTGGMQLANSPSSDTIADFLIREESRSRHSFTSWLPCNAMEPERILVDLKQSPAPYTCRFLSLRLKLAFTKRLFKRVEKTYLERLAATSTNSTSSTASSTSTNETETREGTDNENNNNNRGTGDNLLDILEASFSSLRREIDRIEAGQESMKKRVLPRVQEQLLLHESFACFVDGFKQHERNRESLTECEGGRQDEDQRGICHLKMLDRDEETTTATQKLIAEFAGVPSIAMVHDLRNLESLLLEGHDGTASESDGASSELRLSLSEALSALSS